jgi:type IV pilus assembly protein PilB
MAPAKSGFAEMLLEKRVLTAEQLFQARQQKARTGKLLGETLVELGIVAEPVITAALSQQLSVPYASRENNLLRKGWMPGLENKIREDFSRKNHIVPLYLEGHSLAVAMADPSDMVLIDNIRMMTGLDIMPLIASKTDIAWAINEFFGKVEENKPLDQKEAALSPEAGAKVVEFVNLMFNSAIGERASDIHLEIYGRRTSLRFRIDGALVERMAPPPELYVAVINRIKVLAKLDPTEKRLPQDGAAMLNLGTRNVNLRVGTCPTIFGENVVLRVLDKGSVSLDIDKLGVDDRQKADFLAAIARPHGLIFLTGPTGSGKTTTIYTLLNRLRSPDTKIMTAEDPVEYQLDGVNQLQVMASIGLTFGSAMRTFLRQDPDVIMLGEVRDAETAETCLRAAMTGHLVLSTLHTNSALDAVPRLINLGAEPFMLASTICLVATQRLVRVLCPHCRSPYKPDANMLQVVMQGAGFTQQVDPATVTLFKAAGCDQCVKTGYLGRQAIYEVFLFNEEMAQIIYKNQADVTALREAAKRAGMLTIRQSGLRKVLAGLTSVEEVMQATVG